MSVKQIVIGAAAIGSTSALQFTTTHTTMMGKKDTLCSEILNTFRQEAVEKKVGVKKPKNGNPAAEGFSNEDDEGSMSSDDENKRAQSYQDFYAVVKASEACEKGKMTKIKPAYLLAAPSKEQNARERQGTLNQLMTYAKTIKTLLKTKKRAPGAKESGAEAKMGDFDFDYLGKMRELIGGRKYYPGVQREGDDVDDTKNRFSDSFYVQCCYDVLPDEKAAFEKAEEEAKKKKDDDEAAAKAKQEDEKAAEEAAAKVPDEAKAAEEAKAAGKATAEEGCCGGEAKTTKEAKAES
ncbi:unnamed protein product [Amoebophrya sp. A25]|nr:unnamed protein product [Amoebophrya sp. A25]|eukprot:GSA25T00019685001.1